MNYHTTHSIICSVDAKTLFSLLADVSIWPDMMEPCKCAKIIEKKENNELIELTADVNGIDMTWQSEREIFHDMFRIKSNIFKPMEPVEKMLAIWLVYSLEKDRCLLVLNHDYDIKRDVNGLVPKVETYEEAEQFIMKAIDINSRTELGNIKFYSEQVAEKQNSKHRCYYSYAKIYPIPASLVYQFVRDTTSWVALFNNCEKIELLNQTKDSETVRVWGYQNDELIDWITERKYMDDSYRIDYTLKKQMPLLSEMHGEWQVIPLGNEQCILSVNRYWAIKKDALSNMEHTEQMMQDFVAINTENEFESIYSEILKKRKKTILIKSMYLPFDPKEVYDFMADLAKWEENIPHCKSLNIFYDDSENQEFTMEVAAGLKSEAFRSVRRCDEQNRIIKYFQPVPPPLLQFHAGEWVFIPEKKGTKIIYRHEYVIEEEACKAAFQSDNDSTWIKKVEEMLIKNSTNTLKTCRKYLEAKRS